MTAHPAQALLPLLFGLVSLAALFGALYLLFVGRRRRVAVVRDGAAGAAGAQPHVVRVENDLGGDRRRTLKIALGLVLLLWVFAGKYLVAPFYPHATEPSRLPATESRVRSPTGAELAVAQEGTPGAPTLLFTHGWGADRRDWAYVIAALPASYRVVVWDLPGLGASSPPSSGDYSMQTLAADLDSVVSSLQGQPLILVGHSIGGILNLEYARRFPQKMGREVQGLIQVNTTFTNPVLTKKNAERTRRLQEPVLEPLLKTVDALSPVARGLGWLAYRSGLAHLQLASQSFAGSQTWDQLDEMARYAYRSSPGVVARGVLGMLHWDGSDVLRQIDVPTLVVSGAQDVTTLPAASDRMAREIRAATRLSIEHAAHLGPVEQHEAYAQAIAAFAAKLTSGLAAR